MLDDDGAWRQKRQLYGRLFTHSFFSVARAFSSENHFLSQFQYEKHQRFRFYDVLYDVKYDVYGTLHIY